MDGWIWIGTLSFVSVSVCVCVCVWSVTWVRGRTNSLDRWVVVYPGARSCVCVAKLLHRVVVCSFSQS